MRLPLSGIFLLLVLTGCGKGPGAAGEAAEAESGGEGRRAHVELPLAKQRGLQNHEAGNIRKLVIVKATLATVTDALMKGNPTKTVETDPAHKQLNVKSRSYLVFQLQGHDWTVILNVSKDAIDPQKLAKSTAAYLNTRAVMYGYSDFSGATRYRLFDGARELEAVDAMDEDDASLLLEHAGPDMDPAARKILEEVKAGGGMGFRSSSRKLLKSELDDADRFVDRALKAEDALVPDIGGLSVEAGQKLPMDELPFSAKDLQGMAFVTGDAPPATQPAN